MKALTLTQPWASLVGLGEKRVETRSWTPYGLRPGDELAIHAGKGLAGMTRKALVDLCWSMPHAAALTRAWRAGRFSRACGPDRAMLWSVDDLPRGCVVAVAAFRGAYRTGTTSCLQLLEDSVAQGALYERAFGDYSRGRWAWALQDVRALARPLPARGRQGLWEWEPSEELVFADLVDFADEGV